MNDTDVEKLLRGYRPVGPPLHLRGRIIAPPAPQRLWPWVAAAAVLVLSAMTSRLAFRQQVDVLTPSLGSQAPGDLRDDLTEMFGDDETGRELVNFLLREGAVND